MKLKTNNIKHFNLSRETILDIINDMNTTTVKTNFMNEVDIALFGSHLLVTDHEALITQFVQTSVVWCHTIKEYEDKEDYELCGMMIRTLNKLENKYIAFIVSTEYNEEAVNKIKDAKKLAVQKVLQKK